MSDSDAPKLPPGSRCLFSAEQIKARVAELGRAIARDYEGRRPLLVGVMNGALFFLADLLRAANDLDAELLCVRLASYAGTQSTGELRGLEALDDTAVAGRDVLIVDDILDTGLTLSRLAGKLRELGAHNVRICVLLSKQRKRSVDLSADWVGFQIADEFVVGYGLDYEGRYRALRDIWAVQAPH